MTVHRAFPSPPDSNSHEMQLSSVIPELVQSSRESRAEPVLSVTSHTCACCSTQQVKGWPSSWLDLKPPICLDFSVKFSTLAFEHCIKLVSPEDDVFF